MPSYSPWSVATLYAGLAECDITPNQCIAPKKTGGRCSFSVRSSMALAERLRMEATQLPIGTERNGLIRQFVLLHCCNRWHKNKLEADTSGCLLDLTKAYSADLEFQRKHGLSLPRCDNSRLPQDMGITAKMDFRPRSASTRQVDSCVEPNNGPLTARDYFRPHETSAPTSLRKVLVRNVPDSYAEFGYVYGYIWDIFPELFKIEYTSHRPEHQSTFWKSHGAGRVTESMFTRYPRRMEQLMHLEVVERRHKVNKCLKPTCGEKHNEWFKISIPQREQLFHDWKTLIQREQLYDTAGNLTSKWRHRISMVDGRLTARALHKILDSEDQEVKQTEQQSSATESVMPCIATNQVVMRNEPVRTSELVEDEEAGPSVQARSVSASAHSEAYSEDETTLNNHEITAIKAGKQKMTSEQDLRVVNRTSEGFEMTLRNFAATVLFTRESGRSPLLTDFVRLMERHQMIVSFNPEPYHPEPAMQVNMGEISLVHRNREDTSVMSYEGVISRSTKGPMLFWVLTIWLLEFLVFLASCRLF